MVALPNEAIAGSIPNCANLYRCHSPIPVPLGPLSHQLKTKMHHKCLLKKTKNKSEFRIF